MKKTPKLKFVTQTHAVEDSWSAYTWRTVSLFIIQNKFEVFIEK